MTDDAWIAECAIALHSIAENAEHGTTDLEAFAAVASELAREARLRALAPREAARLHYRDSR